MIKLFLIKETVSLSNTGKIPIFEAVTLNTLTRINNFGTKSRDSLKFLKGWYQLVFSPDQISCCSVEAFMLLEEDQKAQLTLRANPPRYNLYKGNPNTCT
jgi:hypothetical protein